jgi:hypothetical protein
MHIKINNATELKSVATILHDARFTANGIDYDATAHTFILKCWACEPKPKGVGVTSGWQAHGLSFTNVTGCKVNVKEKVSYYELATIRFNERDSRLDLIAHYAVEISLQLGQLDGALTETGERLEHWK